MKASYSSTLITFLQNNRQFHRADLFTITLANGNVLRAADFQQDLIVSGNRFYATKYGAWKRGVITSSNDATQVEEMELDVVCDSTVLFPGSNTPLLQTVASTIFDKARVQTQTAYLPLNYNTNGAAAPVVDPSMVATKHVGDIITAADPLTSTMATFKVSDLTYLMQEPWPRRLVQSGCPFTLFDKNCGLNKADFAVANTVAAGSTALVINLGATLSQAPPYYDKGMITFTSGQNSGLSGAIAKQISTTQIQLSGPFLLPVQVGDQFEIYPGCDLTLTTCTVKFNNASKFGGMPFVPEPEGAVSQ